MALFNVAGSTPSDDGFVIKSGRFNHVDGAGGDYLTRTNIAQGNKRYTWSSWIKLGKLSDGTWSAALFGAYHGSDATQFYFQGANKIRWYENGADLNTTTRAFEDPSAWYHIMAVKSYTEDAGFMKIYVNGELTDTYTNNIPGGSAMTNAGGVVYVSQAPATNATRFAAFDGLQAEVYFVDGTVLGPESFGETNASTGQWVPLNPADIKPTLTWGPNGFYLPMASDKLPDRADSYLHHTNYPTFVDYAQTPTHTVTAHQDAQTSTTQKKFGTSSYYNSGSWGALKIPFSDALGVMGIGSSANNSTFRTGDFTIEGWFYFTDLSATNLCVGNGFGSTTYCQACYISSAPSSTTGNIVLRYFKGNNSTSTLCQGSTAIGEDTWYHLAWVRDGDFLRVYIDGVQDAELSGMNNYSFNPQGYNSGYPGTSGQSPYGAQGVGYDWFIGNEQTIYGANNPLFGYADEIRVSNITRYPNGAPFVLQTEPFEDDRWTKLLLHMEGSNAGTTFTDSAGTTTVEGQNVGRHYYGEFGDVQNQRIKRQQPLRHVDGTGGSHIIGPKFGTGVMGCDGSGDSISVADSVDWDFGTDNFTIEFWINFDHIHTSHPGFGLLGQWASSSSRWSIYQSNSKIAFYCNSPTVGDLYTTTEFVEHRWYHVALERQSTTFRWYINGTLDNSVTDSDAIPAVSSVLGIANNRDGSYNELKGYMDELRISNTARYTGTSFTPETTAFTSDANTKLLMHMDGNMASTAFTDSSSTPGTSLVSVGNVQSDTSVKKFGDASAKFDGTGDYISSNQEFEFGRSDFTIEAWVYFSTVQNQGIMLLTDAATNYAPYLQYYSSELQFGINGIASVNTYSWTPSASTWYHVAVAREGNTCRMFIDGTLVDSATDRTNFISDGLVIGAWSSRDWHGNMDEIRISNVARYTATFSVATSAFSNDDNTMLLMHCDGPSGSSFTAPTTAFTNDSYTKLLLHADGSNDGTTFTDSSGSAHTVTAAGGAHTDTAIKKIGTASAQFDGSGAYLSIADSPDWDIIGPGSDWTIEFWVYPTQTESASTALINHAAGGGVGWNVNWDGSGKVRIYNALNGSGGVASSSAISNNDWTHVAFTYNQLSTKLKVFINGTEDNTSTGGVAWSAAGAYALYMGAQDTGSLIREFTGYMDEIRISNVERYGNWINSATGHTMVVLGHCRVIAPKMGTGCYRNNRSGNGLEFPRGSSPYENSKPFEFWGDSNWQSTGEVATDFTVEAWVCLDDITTNDQQFAMHRDSVNDGDWVFWWDSSNGLVWSGDSNTLNQGNTNGWASKTWIHIAAVRHNCVMTLYVDGVASASNSNNKYYDGNASLSVAGVWSGGSWSNSGAVAGFMDEVRICNEAKYTANFTPPTTASKDSVDTLLLLHLDGGGPGQPGTDTNLGQGIYCYNDASDAVFYDDDGKPIDKAYYKWDGGNDHFVYPNSKDWQHPAGEDFTYEFWMNNWSPNASGTQYALATGTNVTGSSGTQGLVWKGDGGGWYMRCNDSNFNGEIYYAKNFFPNKWKHVVLQRTSDNKIRCYDNGEEIYMSGTAEFLTNGNDIDSQGLALGCTTNQNPRDYEGYITECRVSGVARYSTDFTPPAANLVSDNNTSLLLHMDGANDGTTFTDSGPDAHTVTVSGDTHTDTAIKKLGTASGQFDGTGDYLSIAADAGFNFGSGEFCVEAYVYHTGTPSNYQGIVCRRNSTGWELKINSAQKVSWYDNNSGAETLSNAALANDTWYHVAVTRNRSGVINIWIDGVKQTAFDYTPTFTDYSHALLIGDENQRLAATKWSGYIDEVRISKGVDRYGRFTVPTEQFVMDSDTRAIIRSSWTEGGIGGDDSGNQNDFTPVGIDNPDAQIIDNPQNNWNTLNPAMALLQQTCGAVDYTSGNLTEEDIGAGGTGQNYPCAFGTMAQTSGKWYAEFLALKASGESTIEGGPGVSGVDGFPTSGWNAIGLQGSNAHYVRRGELRGMGQDTSGYPTFDEFDIISVAMDLDNLKAYWAKNNVWITIGGNPGDPTSGATGTGALSMDSLVTAGAYTFEVGSDNTTDGKWACNFGQDSTFGCLSTSVAAPNFISVPTDHPDANGIGQFYYPPPAEYLALCKENMVAPSIADPTKHFNSILYTGDASARSITGMGFQPDLLVVKKRNANYNWQDFDSVRGATGGLMESMHWNNTDQEGTDAGSVSTLDSDGFSIAGSYSGVNANNDTYVAYGWKAGGAASANTDGSITSQVSANTSAGFSIVSYTGTQANATVGHGLSQAPEFMIIKGRDDSDQWSVYHRDIGYTKLAYLNLANAESSPSSTFWQDTHPGASVFTIGSDTQLNKSANPYIAYCFHAVDDYQKIGNFIGNNNADGMFVYLGFKPALVIAKAVAEAYNWTLFDAKRPGYNVTNIQQQPNDNGSETNIGANRLKVDLLANGFKCRSSYAELNSSTQYMYYAVAESPFKTNNAQ